MVKLEILNMKKIIIVLFLVSISVNAQLDSNPFILNTEKITESSLDDTYWYEVKKKLSSSQGFFFLDKEIITNYSEFTNGAVPSIKLHNKKIDTSFDVIDKTQKRSRWARGFPSYWRVFNYISYDYDTTKIDPVEDYSNVSYLRIVNQQHMVYTFDLTNYTIDNSLDRNRVVLNGYASGGYSSTELNDTESLRYSGDFALSIYINKDLLSFEKVVDPEKIDLNKEIEKYVKHNIFEWQEKGEFEKTSNYDIRVNQKSRQKKVIEYEKEAMIKIGGYLIEALKIKSDKLHLGLENIEVSKYDADNETFIISIKHSNYYIPFIIKIPINIAKSFKENLSQAILANAEFLVINNKAVLSYADVKFGDTSYNYNNKNNYSYVETKINYNFDEIIINSNSSSPNSLNVSTNTISKGKSVVDTNIPVNKKNNNRFALVIGNEDYKSMQMKLSFEQNVDYAANDAEIFKDYALKTLGVPEENLHFMINATAGQMSQKIELVSKIVRKVENAELIVYYAGHGFPDEQTKTPYLIPVDVNASNLSSAIKLEDFYTKLSSTNASKITVFLDACFTGGGRNKSLVSSRGIKIKPKQGSLSGNLVVFSASNGNQSSLPFHKEKHGMFTYHLLKKLQESKGKVSLGELSSYLKKEVSIKSLIINEQDQEPIINFSQEVKNYWSNWSFR
jgi:hypothetical protein